jgi:hypothetical protein
MPSDQNTPAHVSVSNLSLYHAVLIPTGELEDPVMLRVYDLFIAE